MNKISAGLWVLLLLPLMANAEIYRSIDADGHVSFSDRPTLGSESIKLKAVTTYTYKAPSVKLNKKTNKKISDFEYQKLELLNPLNEQTIRSQEGIVHIRFNVIPALKKKQGHRYQIILDDKVVVDELVEVQYLLSDVDRGEHTLSIKLLDAGDRVLIESDRLTFFMRKHSVLFRKP